MVRTPVTAALLTVSFACFGGTPVRGSGHSLKEVREVATFDAVEVSSGVHAQVSIGPRKVEVEADDNILPLVETRVEDGRLLIRFKPHTNIWGSGDVNVVVQAPSIRGLEASGGSRIRARLAKADSLDVEVSGGGEVKAEDVDVAQLDASGSGGATLELIGKADKMKLEMSGGTRLKGSKLSTRTVRIDGSGGCTAEFQASELVKGELSGGCEVHLLGKASSRVSTSGGSSVDWED